MAHDATCFSDAQLAWKHWNLTDYEYREECLLHLAKALESHVSVLAEVVRYHLNSAKPLIAGSHDFIGPTGETNELYTSGRGVYLMVQQQSGHHASVAVVAQLSASLIAGNSVVICTDDAELVSTLTSAIEGHLPADLVQIVSLDIYQSMLSHDVRSVGFVGNETEERKLNQALAQRRGAIVNFVSETDLALLPNAQDPQLVLHFITEKTRTINITAIGGNASLLEMGSSPH
jgi:delta 1-pyrroline-5-carboxylate dehydrogenase